MYWRARAGSGRGNSRISPMRSTRPIVITARSLTIFALTYQIEPSGPAMISDGWLPSDSVYSVITPEGVIFPIFPASLSMNHKFPTLSGVILEGIRTLFATEEEKEEREEEDGDRLELDADEEG